MNNMTSKLWMGVDKIDVAVDECLQWGSVKDILVFPPAFP